MQEDGGALLQPVVGIFVYLVHYTSLMTDH